MVLLDLPFTREYFTDLFDGIEGAPNVAHSTHSSEMVRALVSAGFGFSIPNVRPLEYGDVVAEIPPIARGQSTPPAWCQYLVLRQPRT